jgi:3-methyladenine DNA glycosylase Mpg
MVNYNEFFGRGARSVARDLLGRTISLLPNPGFHGQILEVGAYEGSNESPSRKGMLYSPGTLFLMPFRGSEMFNISTDRKNETSCVELRRVDTPDGIISGPGAITNYFEIRGNDGVRFQDIFQLIGEPVGDSRIERVEGNSENCLGFYSIKRS